MHRPTPDAEHVALRNSKLKTLRLSHNYTQQYVADSLGVDASTLCRWEENEEKINLGNLRKIASFYAVGIEWLISPDPLVLHMHDNQLANGAYNTVNVMPKEMLEQMAAQHKAHIDVLQKLTESLIELTDKVLDRIPQRD
ncbi:MAG: helix-turn-helix domain-containing protein [Flavobacteriales bacterium]|nr:helix-turn-helix domain-containing protein [Flavobacteriales bacterium]